MSYEIIKQRMNVNEIAAIDSLVKAIIDKGFDDAALRDCFANSGVTEFRTVQDFVAGDSDYILELLSEKSMGEVADFVVGNAHNCARFYSKEFVSGYQKEFNWLDDVEKALGRKLSNTDISHMTGMYESKLSAVDAARALHAWNVLGKIPAHS